MPTGSYSGAGKVDRIVTLGLAGSRKVRASSPRPPSHCEAIELAAQRYENFVQMPCAARLAPRRLGTPGELSAELVEPATDRFVCDHDANLKQQFINISKPQAEPEIPANRGADEDCREAVIVTKTFRFLHYFILAWPPRQANRAVIPSPNPTNSRYGSTS